MSSYFKIPKMHDIYIKKVSEMEKVMKKINPLVSIMTIRELDNLMSETT